MGGCQHEDAGIQAKRFEASVKGMGLGIAGGRIEEAHILWGSNSASVRAVPARSPAADLEGRGLDGAVQGSVAQPAESSASGCRHLHQLRVLPCGTVGVAPVQGAAAFSCRPAAAAAALSVSRGRCGSHSVAAGSSGRS